MFPNENVTQKSKNNLANSTVVSIKCEGDDKVSYNEFDENAVLTVQTTQNMLFILLKNGIVVTHSFEKKNSKRKINLDVGGGSIPQMVNIKTRLVDLVCGRVHCLAKGLDSKVYSWGSNSHGQLGLGRMTMFAEVPTVIVQENFKVSFNNNKYEEFSQ